MLGDFFRGVFKCIWIFAAAILGIVYILSPLDIIPDVIPVLGWLDDLGVAGWLIQKLISAVYRRIALWVLIIPGLVFGVSYWLLHVIFALPEWLPIPLSLPFAIFGFWKIGKELG